MVVCVLVGARPQFVLPQPRDKFNQNMTTAKSKVRAARARGQSSPSFSVVSPLLAALTPLPQAFLTEVRDPVNNCVKVRTPQTAFAC